MTYAENGKQKVPSTTRRIIAVLVVAALAYVGYIVYGVVTNWDDFAAGTTDAEAVSEAAAEFLTDEESIPGADSASRIDTLVQAGLVSDVEGTYLEGDVVLNVEADGTATCVEVEG